MLSRRAALRFTHFLILFGLPSAAAHADSSRAERARQQLERQVEQMVKPPPASLEVIFDGIDSTRYTFLEGSFAFDGAPLPAKISNADQKHTVLLNNEVTPGEHTLTARLVYEETTKGGLFSYGSGLKFKVPGKFIIKAQRGVALRVRAMVEVDDGAEPGKRLELIGKLEADLRTKLEEGIPPPPPERLAQAETKSEANGHKYNPEPRTQTLKNEATPHRRSKHRGHEVKDARGEASRPPSIRDAVFKPRNREETALPPPDPVSAQAAAPAQEETTKGQPPSAALEAVPDAGSPPTTAVAMVTPGEVPAPRVPPPAPAAIPGPSSESGGAREWLWLAVGSIAAGLVVLIGLAIVIIRSRRRLKIPEE
jgi:hypothetical protein